MKTVTEFETKEIQGFKVDVCKTCSALVFDRNDHHIYHAWPNMTVGQKLAYAKKKRATGQDDAYSASVIRRIPD